MEKVWELTFGPLDDLLALAKLKFEDSGLFLASCLPFLTVPTPPEVRALLGPFAFPQGVPVVRFFMYADASDNDKLAAKSVLYAALKTIEGLRHVFLSHTQADTDTIEENAGDREKQIKVAAAFIEHCIGQTPPFTEEVFFLGDLNVVGHGALDGANTEWTNLFGKAGVCLITSSIGGDATSARAAPAGATTRASPPMWSTSLSGSAWITCSHRQHQSWQSRSTEA